MDKNNDCDIAEIENELMKNATNQIINYFHFYDQHGNVLTFKKPIENITFIGVPNNDPIHYRWNIQTIGHVYFSDNTHQKFLFDFKRKKAFLIKKD